MNATEANAVIEAAIAQSMKPMAEMCKVVVKDGRAIIVTPEPDNITSYCHKTIGGKNYFVAYTERNHKFTIEPHFVDATRIGFALVQDQCTGTYQEFLEAFKDFIEFDKSYKTGVFNQYENPVPLLKQACWEDLSFDNWWHKYSPSY